MAGWIKVHRKIFNEKGLWKNEALVRIYLYLVFNAKIEPETVYYMGQSIELNVNELITGRKIIAQNTNVPESSVEKNLNVLELCHIIRQKKNRRCRLISILYEDFGTQKEHKSNRSVTQKERKSNRSLTDLEHINKKEKENNNDNDNNTYFNYDQNENNSLIPSFDQVEIIRHPICQYVTDNLPNVAKIRNQLTDEQADKLDREFTRAEIINVLMSMENYNGISKKYNTVYLTCLTWLKNRKDNGKQPQRAKTYSDYLRENGVEP